MADIATIWDPVAGVGDWAISIGRQHLITDEHGDSIGDGRGGVLFDSAAAFEPGSGLVADLDLQTAVLISLFTDAEASDDDVVPDGSDDRRGWWAGPIGSKLWLRARSKATPGLPALIRNDIEQALAWLIEDQVAAAIDVSVAYFAANAIGATVVLRRQDGTRLALRFTRVWEKV